MLIKALLAVLPTSSLLAVPFIVATVVAAVDAVDVDVVVVGGGGADVVVEVAVFGFPFPSLVGEEDAEGGGGNAVAVGGAVLIVLLLLEICCIWILFRWMMSLACFAYLALSFSL